MRIVSLLPSATEICYALGLGRQLVAVTHECDYPTAAVRKPHVTSSAIDHHGKSSAEIHQLISGQLHSGSAIYGLDTEQIHKLKPDLNITQELCSVCAVAYPEVQQAARTMPGETTVISLEPLLLEHILETIITVGKATGREAEAREVVAGLQRRIDRVAAIGQKAKERPRMYCMEWMEPPFVGGHWVPQMIDLAGGIDGLGKPGYKSTPIKWEVIRDYQPEVIVYMPCGFNLARTIQHIRRTPFPSWWRDLPAVKSGRTYAVNGSAYFNRPGPRIVDGLEILGHAIHPELFDLSPRLQHSIRRLT
ncbi:MAG: cobalamin-binding protein [Chloroflexi bacterium]|nr:cobalamin-binding protein [Chloroflexota bacterium]